MSDGGHTDNEDDGRGSDAFSPVTYPEVKRDASRNVCRRTCFVFLGLLFLGGCCAVAIYWSVVRRGNPVDAANSNTVAESEETGKSSAANYRDRNKPFETKARFYGLGYSPFGLGDNRLCRPYDKIGGMCILADQVKADMRQIGTMTKRVKLYSLNCFEQTLSILDFAKKNSMTIMLGVWVDSDAKKNDKEIKRLELVLEDYAGSGVITEIIVGNEAVFIQRASEKELVRTIKNAKDVVKKSRKKIPVGTAVCLGELCRSIFPRCQ